MNFSSTLFGLAFFSIVIVRGGGSIVTLEHPRSRCQYKGSVYL